MSSRCFLFLFLLLLISFPRLSHTDLADDDAERAQLRDRNKKFESREMLREKRELQKEIDYEAYDRKMLLLRQQQEERENYLKNNFAKVVFAEVAKARRTYDTATVQFLEIEGKARYLKNPENQTFIRAMAVIYLFNCEYLTYRLNTTPLIFEKSRLRKDREQEGLKGLILVEKLLVHAPDDPELLRMKGILLACQQEKKFSKKKHFLEAEAVLKQAVTLSNGSMEAKLVLAHFYFNQPEKLGRNVAAAVELANGVLKDHPQAVDALLIVGRAEEEKYNYALAFRHFKNALAVEPKNPEVEFYYLLAKRDKKRFKKLMES